MAQGAGIQLEVGLDLAFFRNQLVGLQAVTTGTKLSFGVTFKRLDIQNELNALATNIKKRNYFLEVKTNLASEIDNAKKLADSLARLQQVAQGTKGALPIGTGALGLKKGAGQPGANEIRALYEALAMAGAEGFETGTRKNRAQMVAQIGAVAKDTVAGLLNGLDSQDAKVQAAARSLGESLIASMKAVLGIASPSKEFEKIGKNVGEGFEKGALSSMDNAFDALENKMRQRGKILDTVARGIFRMLGMDPVAMLQQAREQRATPARAPIAGLLPSSTAKGKLQQDLEAFMGATSGRPPVAQGPGMLALSNEALGRRVSAILQEYFKVAEVQVRESFDPRELKRSLNVFSYIAQSLRDAESRTKQARVAESVDSLMQAIDNAVRIAQARVRVSRVQVSELGPRAQGALSAGRVAGLLPGRPSQASVLELNNILAGAIREYFAAVARGIKPNIGVQGRPLLGPGSAVAGLLPAAGGTTPRGQMRFNAVSTGAVLGRPQILRAPNIPSPIGGAGAGGGVPPRPPSGGGGGGMGGFGRALGGINLPGTGVVREIGNEFAMATKQVLLFGTAYKALAFLTSFPAQVGQAVGALQSFNNTLKAISPTAEEARASNQFILDIVDRYNVPLQSARDGFTKLYASMAPAGFKGDEIRELFTGVSQAAATFGMSADKVDRVNYAFAQMASKGQVMSEELKGQLGDVLPGAMGIFAEAAGMEGPDAIQKFSKALEDGAYKGEAMRVLLKNVSVVLTKEFGPGAEGAARTFQGVINRMQNSTKLLYEAFEPVAVGFLNSVVVPLTSGIKTVADGFNAFFRGVNAKTSGGFAIAQELEKLKPVFEGIRTNLTSLLPAFQSFGQVVLQLSKVFLQIAGNPFVGYLARVYLSVLPLTIAIRALNLQALIPLIASFLRAIPAFVAFTVASARGATVLQSVRTAAAQTGQTALVTAGQVKLLSTTLKAAFASTVVLAIVAGIGMIIEKMISLGARMDEVRQKAMGAAESIRSMSQADARQAANQAASDVRLIQGISQREQLPGQAGRIAVSPQEQAALERAGVSTQTTATRGRGAQGIKQTVGLSQLRGAIEARQGIRREAEFRQRVIKSQDEQATAPVTLVPIVETGKDDRAGAARELDTYSRSQLDFIKQNAEQEKLALDRRLQQQLISETQYKISLAELELETTKLEQAEKLRLAKEQINKDNLSAQDKQLKLADAQIGYQNELNIAQDKYTVAVESARKELEGPFNQALEGANAELLKQQMIAGNLQAGIAELTPDQESYLQVVSLVTGKTEDELNILKDKIAALRETLELTKQIAKENRFNERLNQLRDEIEALRIINSEERRLFELRKEGLSNEEAQKIFDLEKIKKNIEGVRALIDGFVTQTSSDYKGFLKAVISGEDAADALKQFQEGLTDRVLTIFLDFAMAPVEKFMKEAFEGLFLPKAPKELKPEDEKAKTGIEGNTVATDENTTAIKDLTAALRGEAATPSASSFGGAYNAGPAFDAANVFGGGGNLTGGIFDTIAQQMGGATESLDSFSAHMGQFVDSSIASAESLGSWNQSMATSLSESLTKQTDEANKQSGEWQKSLGTAVSAIGIAAGAVMGIAAGISQIKKGGTSNVLGGIGSIFMSLGGAIGGLGNLGLFGADGGVAPKGWKPFPVSAFANGGMVNGPTLGLVGEGKYNEAIVPLPNGRSIPVDLGDSLREKMGNASPSSSSSPVLSMSFETTSINGVEYVSRDQLEQAMMETRKLASKEGAMRGANLAIDRLQQSPNIRRRVGMR